VENRLFVGLMADLTGHIVNLLKGWFIFRSILLRPPYQILS